jgi:hypothetical protein
MIAANDNDFQPFNKIPRLARECAITEKIDGTNAQVWIVGWGAMGPEGHEGDVARVYEGIGGYSLYAGSRSRFLQPGKATDNFGFAEWVRDNADELVKLGPGRHFGEWWGHGINRGYGLSEKRFSLFNVGWWAAKEDDTVLLPGDVRTVAPACCHVVPTLYRGRFCTEQVRIAMVRLRHYGSAAAPDFMRPEGVIVYHEAARQLFKATLEGDAEPKSASAALSEAA